MIYLAIPTISPRLERCALEAIERTTPEPHRVIVARGGTHGENLDRAFAALPEDARYFFTMDDDAAPLKVGWLSWMLETIAQRNYLAFGDNMAVGCLYRVSFLRQFGPWYTVTRNPGDVFRHSSPGYHLARWEGPWWLRNCEAYCDHEGRPIFAHLGGGTIGHTWLHKGRLYPRIPTWLWPIMVRRHLDRAGAPRPRDRGRDAGGQLPLVIDRVARPSDGARFLDSQHPHGARQSLEAGSVAQMERARKIQCWMEHGRPHDARMKKDHA